MSKWRRQRRKKNEEAATRATGAAFGQRHGRTFVDGDLGIGQMREQASDEDFGIDPRMLTLAGHQGDARELLAYFFAAQFNIVKENRFQAGLMYHLSGSANYIYDDDAAEFARIMEHEPFAYRILTAQLSDVHALATCEDAAAFLELFFSKFPK